MQIIPVLDVRDGIAVHGKKGERENYHVVKGIMGDGADPVSLFDSYCKKLSCREIYVADLNAIEGRGNNYGLLEELASSGKADLLVDAGANAANGIRMLLSMGAKKVVIGSETLKTLDEAQKILYEFMGRIVFSIDIMYDQIVTKYSYLKKMKVDEAFSELSSLGFNEFIVLFLSNVGTGSGLNMGTLKKISTLKTRKKVTLITGGGIKNRDDLVVLRNLGYDGALLATALHEGWITNEDLPVE